MRQGEAASVGDLPILQHMCVRFTRKQRSEFRLPLPIDSAILRVMVWTPNRIIAFFLVLGITLAPALFAAPATGLTLQMSMTHDVGSNECDCCSDAKPNRDLCVWMCVLPPATLQSNHLVSIAFHDNYALRRELTLSSRAISPDPPPPRSIAFR
jgi:hypothetical protein